MTPATEKLKSAIFAEQTLDMSQNNIMNFTFGTIKTKLGGMFMTKIKYLDHLKIRPGSIVSEDDLNKLAKEIEASNLTRMHRA